MASLAIRQNVSSPEVVSSEELRKAIFAKGPVLPKIPPSVASGLTFANMNLVGDPSSFYRSTEGMITSYISWNPDTQIAPMGEVFASKDMALNYHAFGMASAMNTIIGLIQVKDAFHEHAYVEAIGDRRAQLLKKLSIVQGGAFAGAGISFATFRPLAMVSTLEHISSTSLLGRVTTGAAYLGSIFYILFFAVFALVFGIQLYEGAKFKKKLNQTKGLAEQIEMLQKQLNVDPAKVFAKEVTKFAHLSDTEAEKTVCDALIKEALSSAKEGVRGLVKELGMESIPEEHLENIVRSVIGGIYTDKTPEEVKELVDMKLMFAGLKVKVQKVQLKKQSKVGRVINASGMSALKELSGNKDLAERVRLGDPKAIDEAKSLIETIQKANKSKMTEAGILMGVLILGVIAMILPFILVSATGVFVSSGVMLLFSTIMMSVDGYYLWQSYKGGQSAAHDKKIMAISTILGIASFLSVITLAATGVITMGVPSLVVLIVLTALWLGQNGVTLAVMNRNDAKHRLENPTLDSFKEALESKLSDEKIMEMLGNLPVEIIEEILGEFTKAFNIDGVASKREAINVATLKVIKEIEKIKQEHLERLRVALVSHLLVEA